MRYYVWHSKELLLRMIIVYVLVSTGMVLLLQLFGSPYSIQKMARMNNGPLYISENSWLDLSILILDYVWVTITTYPSGSTVSNSPRGA